MATAKLSEMVTRLGRGHFITTRTTFQVEEEVVAIRTNVLFRYDTEELER